MSQYRIFIGHAWKYSKHYKRVEQWLNEAQSEGEFTWSNCSEYEDKPLVELNSKAGKANLQEELDCQIKSASIVIVLSGMYTNHSDWIGYEIDSAVNNGKHIIGIQPWTQGKVPKKISENANTMVGWDKSSLIKAIKNS